MIPQWKHLGSWRYLHLQWGDKYDHEITEGIGKIHTWFDVQDHLHRFLPKGHHCVETSQVEVVLDEVLCHFTEIFMARKGAEPTDPCQR